MIGPIHPLTRSIHFHQNDTLSPTDRLAIGVRALGGNSCCNISAGECPGTDVATEHDQLHIANSIASKQLAKSIVLTTDAAKRLQTMRQERENEVFGALP